jgi:hypothetical protein
LVVQSDLKVALQEASGPAASTAPLLADLKLNLSLYREGDPAPRPPNTP